MKHFKGLLLAAAFAFGTQAISQTTTKVVNGKTYIVHKVVSGETLYKLSKKYDSSVKDIESANASGEDIKIGQELLIPVKGETANTAVTRSGTENHTVKSGETLSKIASNYGTTVAKLKELNNLSSDDIRIGQTIKVPALVSASTVKEVTEPAVVKPTVKAVENKVETSTKPEKVVATETVAESKEDKKLANPRNPTVVKTKAGEGEINKAPQGGMPESAEVVLAETATEKEEKGIAKLVSNMDQTRTFVMHPTLSKGSIIVVINENTGKMAYCRVVENIKISDLNGANIAITKAVADKIGMKESSGNVTIKYAAP